MDNLSKYLPDRRVWVGFLVAFLVSVLAGMGITITTGVLEPLIAPLVGLVVAYFTPKPESEA